MASFTTIKLSHETKARLYYIRGPKRDYNAAVEELIDMYEQRKDPRCPPASKDTGSISYHYEEGIE